VEFFVGANTGSWLKRKDVGVPLCVAYPHLAKLKGELPRAVVPWILDSGGFNQITIHGEYRVRPIDYIRAVERFADEIGMLCWAAQQDWMVERPALASSGRSVECHQRLTIENYCVLRSRSKLFIPSLQGDSRDAYLRHVDQFARYGIRLDELPLVSVGSVCRMQSTPEIGRVLTALASLGLKMHGFGVKTLGLRRFGHLLVSADSMAWSTNARKNADDIYIDVPPHIHPRGGKTCSSCPVYALAWRKRMLASIPLPPKTVAMELPALYAGGKVLPRYRDMPVPAVRHRPGIPIYDRRRS
jgi:hypothetical protein